MGNGIEQVAEKLLQDFERGRITRRQMIRNLSVAVAAAAGVASLPSAEAAGRTLHVASVNHISYQVPDYTKIRDFYSDLFGMKISGDNGRQCYLAFGDTTLIARNGHAPGVRVDHIAYTVDNWDHQEVEGELNRRGLRPRADLDSFHIKDPAGFDVQIAKPGFLAESLPKPGRGNK